MRNPLSGFLVIIFLLFAGCTKDLGSSSASVVTQGKGGSTARFTISGNYLYTVDGQNLTTYDIANAANPISKNTQQVGFEIETIFPFGDKLFIGSTTVIHIFSLSNPAKPEKLSMAISPTVMRRCDPVVAKDTVAYATLRTNSACGGGVQSILAAYDIKDITKPVQRGVYTLESPLGLGYADTVLYVCDKPGLILFNIKNAYSPQYISILKDGEYFDVIPYGNLLFCWTKSGAIIYDITNPAKPVKLSTIL